MSTISHDNVLLLRPTGSGVQFLLKAVTLFTNREPLVFAHLQPTSRTSPHIAKPMEGCRFELVGLVLNIGLVNSECLLLTSKWQVHFFSFLLGHHIMIT